MENIKDYEIRLEEPEFIQDEDFRVIIWRKSAKTDEPQFGPDAERVIKSEAQDEPQNEPQKTASQRCRILLETIISKPHLTKERSWQTTRRLEVHSQWPPAE